MARERLRQIKADFPVLSIQPGGELRDQAVGPTPCLITMPSHLPLRDKSAPSILADGLLCASDFLQVGAGKLLTKLKGLLPFLRQQILMLFLHSISCFLRTIFRYWKGLLSVTSKASVFSGAIVRPLPSNQRFARHRLSLILSFRIPTSSVAHTTSASSAKPTMLVPAGRSMRTN